jgi:hypothetical protein
VRLRGITWGRKDTPEEEASAAADLLRAIDILESGSSPGLASVFTGQEHSISHAWVHRVGDPEEAMKHSVKCKECEEHLGNSNYHILKIDVRMAEAEVIRGLDRASSMMIRVNLQLACFEEAKTLLGDASNQAIADSLLLANKIHDLDAFESSRDLLLELLPVARQRLGKNHCYVIGINKGLKANQSKIEFWEKLKESYDRRVRRFRSRWISLCRIVRIKKL